MLEVQDVGKCLEIGKGSFGKVVKLRLGTDSRLYMTKRTRDGDDSAQLCASPFAKPALKFATSEDGERALKREIDIHHRINLAHQGSRSILIDGIPVCAVASVFDAMDDDHHLTVGGSTRHDTLNAVLMDRMDSNLYRYLKWRSETPCDNPHDQAMHILDQVNNGLRQLHSMRIIHADLSTGNVLVRTINGSSDVDVKISDFGNCRFVGSDLKEFSKSEYVLYLHPKQFNLDNYCDNDDEFSSCPKASPSFDFWSYSILVFDVLSQFARRQDQRINIWLRQNRGLEVYKMVTGDFHFLMRRIAYVCNIFAIQHCRNVKQTLTDQSDIEGYWFSIIKNGLVTSS